MWSLGVTQSCCVVRTTSHQAAEEGHANQRDVYDQRTSTRNKPAPVSNTAFMASVAATIATPTSVMFVYTATASEMALSRLRRRHEFAKRCATSTRCTASRIHTSDPIDASADTTNFVTLAVLAPSRACTPSNTIALIDEPMSRPYTPRPVLRPHRRAHAALHARSPVTSATVAAVSAAAALHARSPVTSATVAAVSAAASR
ncbi:uncharacterized protein PITG_10384 [Phytophthora infestans T30-4]|uniref:Uncharacterized protein n=1 Tax=Phytophthora infestans (strain T30-4) TaxID=403677 RepID=D0NF69_PHYIT|nr:uncharacterized protein PITG_10384 [Phytophthora infestans T30-4]EEY56858.1 hypothetical protein PITG_10384 [Phytophthora infestans T30-4]|eukprot:XP_002902186.1 hypothetical protein PITG_10384 [Phytophthora infestans T30-4]